MYKRQIQDYGFSTADEMLYPENYSYLSDVLSYIAIGARSVENQQHRLTSSGVDVPVGMKNPTGGDLGVMLNAVYAAQHGHDFIYRTMEVTTDGNPLAHKMCIRDRNQPSPLLALLFSTTLAPVAGEFGWIVGILAGFLHSSVALNAVSYTHLPGPALADRRIKIEEKRRGNQRRVIKM